MPRDLAILGPPAFRTPTTARELRLERGIERATVNAGLATRNDFREHER